MKNLRAIFFLTSTLGVGVLSTVLALNWKDIDLQKVASGSGKLLQGAAGLSDESEQKIGREVASRLAAQYGLIDDEAKLQYLALIGQTLIKNSARRSIPYHFGILKSEEVNARATPGGYVFVTEGLLKFVKSEAELGGVLAHEISHITQKHIAKAIRKSNLLGAGIDFASVSGQNVEAFSKVTDYSMKLLENGLSREDELDADRAGVLLAAKTGYDATAFKEVVSRLGDSKGSVFAHLHKTHPPTAQRVRVIATTLKKCPSGGERLPERFQKVFPS